MTKCIYLAWQDQATRGWHVVGQLLKKDKTYEFRYTLGVKKISNFSVLPSMPDHDQVYRSEELLSLFKNRLMPKSRPDYQKYMSWMGFTSSDLVDELDALAISGGEKETDFFRIIPIPEKKNSQECFFKFFVNGISHMHEHSKELVNKLNQGETLYILQDYQNKYDKFALMLRTDEPPILIGYIPAYLTKVVSKLKEEKGNDSVNVKVAQVNIDAPLQKRLLCSLLFDCEVMPWEQYEDEFKTIVPY